MSHSTTSSGRDVIMKDNYIRHIGRRGDETVHRWNMTKRRSKCGRIRLVNGTLTDDIQTTDWLCRTCFPDGSPEREGRVTAVSV